MEFEVFAWSLISKGQNKWVAYRAYNAYSRFIHSLYEFLLGARLREHGVTRDNANEDELDAYAMMQAQRILESRRSDIVKGLAPDWENSLNDFPASVPPDFAKDFRRHRNKLSGHVTYERASKMSLTEFYRSYHKFVHMLYHDAAMHWSQHRKEEFPELGEVTKFSVLFENQKKPPATAMAAEQSGLRGGLGRT